jgi:mannose-1-phosphate guanylyltransferase/mannose-6-phosphate isomerase
MIDRNEPDGVVLLLPSDHVISDTAAYADAIHRAISVAQRENLIVTLGAKPDRVETGFGYIRAGKVLDGFSGAHAVSAFVEKPNAADAETFLRDRDYLWNCGIFVFQARSMIAEIEKFAPEILHSCKQSLDELTRDSDFVRLRKDAFEKVPCVSLDVAIMEKTNRAAVVPCDIGWQDAGSWSSVWSLQARDRDGNAIRGDVTASETKNSLIYSEDILTAVVGLNDVVVVSTPDAVLVAGKDSAQSVASLVAKLKEERRTEAAERQTVLRPWGSYRSVLSGAGFQVKEIVVKPSGRLSLQMHHKRAEHWIVVAGVARVTCDDKVFDLRANESTFIPLGAKHRLENLGDEPLCLIEVQCGSYLGEDDIVRFEDVYGRVKPGV